MDRQLIFSKYKKSEDKLLISKFLDKVDIASKENKIAATDFYNESEQTIIKKVINLLGIENCIFYGGRDNSERKLIVIYPSKMKDIVEEKNFKFDTIISVFRVIPPKDSALKYNHSVYLGGLIKLGIKREKIGDIIVYSEGADIIVKKEIEKYVYTNIATLTRFSNARINNIKVEEIKDVEQSFKEMKIVTSSLRLDNIVSELAKTSRNKANDILNEERVFINYECQTKGTKSVESGDIITIRGKGKFLIEGLEGNTRKGNYVLIVKQWK